eukprot:PhF_6_TR8345/c0_g1_i1/m.13066
MQPHETVISEKNIPSNSYIPLSSALRPHSRMPKVGGGSNTNTNSTQQGPTNPMQAAPGVPQQQQQQQPKRPILLPTKIHIRPLAATYNTMTGVTSTATNAVSSPKKNQNQSMALTLTSINSSDHTLASMRSPERFRNPALQNKNATSPQKGTIVQRHISPPSSPVPPFHDHGGGGEEGFSVTELMPPAPDRMSMLRKTDLSIAIPTWDPLRVCVPKFTFGPGAINKSHMCCAGDPPQEVPQFFVVRTDEEDSLLARALQYHTFVETDALFEPGQGPIVTPEGTLLYTPVMHSTGQCVVWVRLADNSSVNSSTMEVSTTDPISFTIYVNPNVANSKNSAVASTKGKDWKSLSNKTTSEVTNVRNEVQLARTLTGQQLSQQQYVFPPSEFVVLHQDPTGAGTKLTVTSPLSALDRIRIAHLLQERSKLVGDEQSAVGEATEERMKERIAKEMEKANGDQYAIELVPLYMRLAQVYYHKGIEFQEECLKCMDNIVTIHLRQIGVQSLQELHQSRAVVEGGGSGEGGSDAKNTDALCMSLHAAGTMCKHLGKCSQALEYFSQALFVAEKTHGKDNLYVTRAELQIAEVYCFQGKFAEALDIYERCYDTADLLMGNQNSATVSILQYLGFAASQCGDAVRGCNSQERAVASRLFSYEEAKSGDATLARAQTYLYAESLLFKAHAEHAAGRNESAVEMCRQAVDLMDQYDLVRVPEYTLGLCFAQLIYGNMLLASGQPGDAFLLFRRAVDLARSQITSSSSSNGVGENTSVELACMEVELAAVLWNYQLNRSEARELTLHALTVFKATVGELHPYTLQTSLNYMAMFESVPRKHELTYACASYLSQHLNPQHPSALSASEQLAQLLVDTKRYTEALDIFGSLDRAYQQVVFGVDTKVERVLSKIVNVHAVLKKVIPTDTITRIYQYVKLIQEKHGEWSGETITMLIVLSKAYHTNGEYDRTHHYLTKALKIADKFNMIFLLGHLFRPASQLTQQEIAERNRMASERMTTAMTLQFANILYCIAVTYEAQSRLRDAELTFMQSLAAFELAQQPLHKGCCTVLESIGSLLFAQGHYGYALVYVEKAFTMRDDRAYEHYQFVIQNKTTTATNHADLPNASSSPTLVTTNNNHKSLDWFVNIVRQEIWKHGYVLVRHESSRLRFAVYI